MRSARTIIDWLSPDDFDEAYDIFNAEDALKYIAPLRFLNKAEHYERFQKKYDEMVSKQAYHWACRLEHSKELIALLNLKANEGDDKLFLGYIIKKEYWGKGFGSELAAWIVNYCDDILKLPKVYALIEEHNEASRKILTRLGFALYEKQDDKGIGLEVYKLRLKNKE